MNDQLADTNRDIRDRQDASNLLQALTGDDLAILARILSRWDGDSNEVLYDPGDEVDHVYFPCGPSMVSFRVALADGPDVETVLVGREGAVGGIVSQGRLPAYARAVVQYPGPFLRAETAALEAAKHQSATLRHFFARYADCLLAQVFQSVACNAAHSIEQRTAKWLLYAVERTGDDLIALTQEQLAGMLGVGRTYVNRVIQSMKARGMLQTGRGRMRILDRPRLDRIACRCEHDVRRHFEEVLRGVYPGDRAGPTLDVELGPQPEPA
ncbi:Crp/Fnr family transcriptional regulator [Thalassobaculum sp.]|uniref:Crp/Fnr family transcriptional regulator n=1 Tax=Thalassobaculum sp. TaxID=2022740 RepID=UPI0032EF641C